MLFRSQRFLSVYKWDKDPLIKKIKFQEIKKREQFSVLEDSILCEIYNYTLDEELINVVVPDEESNIIAIEYRVDDDTLAKFFPKILLDEVTFRYINAKTRLSQDNVRILQHQTDSVRAELNQSLYSSAHQTDEIFGLNPAFKIGRAHV